MFDFALLPVYLLGQGGHVHGLDLPEGGELLQPLPGLLLHGDHEGILDVAVLCKLFRCENIFFLQKMFQFNFIFTELVPCSPLNSEAYRPGFYTLKMK